MSERLSPMMEALKQVRNTPSTVRDALAGRDKRLREEMKTKNPAPCDELETVEYQYKPGGNDYWTNTTRHKLPECKAKGWQTRKLVTRQNAEEVIAAKNARIAELENAIKVKGGNEHSPTQDAYDLACQAIEKHRDRADALEADNKRLREALECLTTFANSFHITVVDNFYQDVTLHLNTPHSLATRILSDSSKSFIFKDLEERRRIATALGEAKP